MRFEDNIPFEDKESDKDHDRHLVIFRVTGEAMAVGREDARLQAIQTMAEMDEEEMLDAYDEGEIAVEARKE